MRILQDLTRRRRIELGKVLGNESQKLAFLRPEQALRQIGSPRSHRAAILYPLSSRRHDMAVSPRTRKLIESGNFDALEDEWLTRLTESPDGIDYFAGTARSLAAAGNEELTRQLLELLDEHLVGDGLWEARITLLEQAGHLLLNDDSEALHAAILETIRAIYPGSDIFDSLAEKLGLHRAVHDIPKTWKKVAQLRTLLSYDRGTIVRMEDRGVGEITDVNITLEKLRVDLAGKGEITVGFGAAAKVLEVLPPDHFLFRKVRMPDELRDISSEDPPRALQLLLESMATPLSAGAVRDAFSGLVDESAWSSWWSSAKGHPQVITSGKGARQTYTWAASKGQASEETLRLFESSDLNGQLEIMRREAKRDSGAVSEMADRLRRRAAEVADSRPAEAFTIAETLESVFDDETDHLASAELLRASDAPLELVASLEDKALRRRSVDLVREVRPDWIEIFRKLLERETEPRILSAIASSLAGKSPDQLEAAFDEIVAHPRRKAAAFVWLAENLSSFPSLEGRNPLRLMQLILAAEHAREFAPFRSRLTKLVESSDTLPHLIARLDPEQARRAEDLLQRAPYEEYVRQPLINALHLRFPDLARATSDVLYALPASIDGRRRELKELLDKEIPENRRAIEEARALGDLRENFEYKSARQRHEYLSARATKMESELRRVRAIDLDRIDVSEVRIGTIVTLGTADDLRRLTILGPWESDPESGVVSYESESAQRLLGLAVGDQIEDAGTEWTIDAIEPFSG
jgi:transcription elongation GreA/GreB family factor